MEAVAIDLTQPSLFSMIRDFTDNYYGKGSHIPHYLNALISISNRSDVQSVAECGVFQGYSTAAFLFSDIVSLYSYDIDMSEVAPHIFTLMGLKGKVNWSLIPLNSVRSPISCPVDFLFLDTQHNYSHVKAELQMQSVLARRYIAVHDSNYPPGNSGKGVRQAIHDFVSESDGLWGLMYDSEIDTGLTVIRNMLAS